MNRPSSPKQDQYLRNEYEAMPRSASVHTYALSLRESNRRRAVEENTASGAIERYLEHYIDLRANLIERLRLRKSHGFWISSFADLMPISPDSASMLNLLERSGAYFHEEVDINHEIETTVSAYFNLFHNIDIRRMGLSVAGRK